MTYRNMRKINHMDPKFLPQHAIWDEALMVLDLMAKLQLISEMQSRSRVTRAACASQRSTTTAVDVFVKVRPWCH